MENPINVYVDNERVKSFIFSAGEVQVKLPKLVYSDDVNLKIDFRNSDDIMGLMLTVNALRNKNPMVQLSLEMPYVPYARQDRACCDGEAFSLEVLANIVNSLNFNRVLVVDPHSNVCRKLIHNLEEAQQYEVLKELKNFIKTNQCILVAPDEGAVTKTILAAKKLECTSISCFKKRDPKDGKILGVEVPEIDPNRHYFIIDDICDGGRTFVELAKVFKDKGVENLSLFVTHGIFSKGFDELYQYFSNIFCGQYIGSGVDKSTQI